MNIKQILEMPIGQRLNPGTLTIKTAKKKWQVGEVWWQQVILFDKTGEIPADVKLGKYLPLNGKTQISCIVAEVQNAEYLGKDRKKLVVDQYAIPTTSMAEYESHQEQMDDELKLIVEGKIRHGIVCSMIQRSHSGPITLKFSQEQKNEISELVNFIMTGE